MHPDQLAQLIMAARGHQGLPPVIHMPGNGPAPGAPLPPQTAAPGPELPPAMPPSGGPDRSIASRVEEQLLAAAQQAKDPALKQTFSVALAAIHKYLANDAKEHQAALGGKLSPRLMAQAHGAG